MLLLYPTGTRAQLEKPPYVVYGLLATFALIQVPVSLVHLLDSASYTWLLNTFGFVPARTNLWGLVTSLFLHMGWFHLLGNALYLWLFGAGLENRIGHAAFAILFVTAGICGGLIHGTGVHALAYGTPVVGASGAVFGVFGAYLVLMPLTDIRFSGCCLFWSFSFHIAAIWFLPFWFLHEFVMAKWMGGPGVTVASWAHVGGFLIGIPVGVLVKTSEGTEKKEAVEKRVEVDQNVAAIVFRKKQEEVRVHLQDGNFQAAWAAYAQLQQEFPGAVLDADCQLRLAEQAAREGEFSHALDIYRALANSNRSDEMRARAAYRMGVIYLERLVDRERAARVFQLLINKFPNTDAARGAEERLREIFPQG